MTEKYVVREMNDDSDLAWTYGEWCIYRGENWGVCVLETTRNACFTRETMQEIADLLNSK